MTPHIKAKKDQISKYVILSGCPLRAQKMTQKFLKNFKLVSNIRNICFYTGYYQNVEITIGASGMGMASIGIYSHELFSFYDVQLIIRAGSCGAFNKELNLYDLLYVKKIYSEKKYLEHFISKDYFEQENEITKMCYDVAIKKRYRLKRDIVAMSQQEFYFHDQKKIKALKEIYQIDVVEMEAFALFANAKLFNRHALCLLTVSDILDIEHDQDYQVIAKISDEDREEKLSKMFKYALDICVAKEEKNNKN